MEKYAICVNNKFILKQCDIKSKCHEINKMIELRK